MKNLFNRRPVDAPPRSIRVVRDDASSGRGAPHCQLRCCSLCSRIFARRRVGVLGLSEFGSTPMAADLAILPLIACRGKTTRPLTVSRLGTYRCEPQFLGTCCRSWICCRQLQFALQAEVARHTGLDPETVCYLDCDSDRACSAG